jgi:hypothetical protein
MRCLVARCAIARTTRALPSIEQLERQRPREDELEPVAQGCGEGTAQTGRLNRGARRRVTLELPGLRPKREFSSRV